MTVARAGDWNGLDDSTKLRLLITEVDEMEASWKAEMAALRTQNQKILWTLVGLVISTGTGAILFALNLAVIG